MRFWFMLAAALILAGCSSHRAPPPNPRLADSITVVANLNEQLRSWRGAPYRYGGMTPRGVDCSGFVVRTFRDKFALQLPRETREQAEIGTRIDKRDLLPGDLVFFKTGSGESGLHVGIYDTDNQFIHASTSRASPVPRWITSTGTKVLAGAANLTSFRSKREANASLFMPITLHSARVNPLFRHYTGERGTMTLSFTTHWRDELPDFYTSLSPTPLDNARLIWRNAAGATAGVPDALFAPESGAGVWGGEALLPGMSPLAQVYSGHQFGAGRPAGRRTRDPARRAAAGGWPPLRLASERRRPDSLFADGDGRAVLRSTIRESLASEAMHALGIPTTRARRW